jgi:hypothetical protein
MARTLEDKYSALNDIRSYLLPREYIYISFFRAMKQCMDIDARPHVCGIFLMFVLTLADGCTLLGLLSYLMSGDRD